MFAVTSSWLVPLAVTLYSLCLHSNPRRLYEIQIVHDGLRASEMKELHKAIPIYQFILPRSRKNCSNPSRTGIAADFPPCPTSAFWLPACFPSMTGSCIWMQTSC